MGGVADLLDRTGKRIAAAGVPLGRFSTSSKCKTGLALASRSRQRRARFSGPSLLGWPPSPRPAYPPPGQSGRIYFLKCRISAFFVGELQTGGRALPCGRSFPDRLRLRLCLLLYKCAGLPPGRCAPRAGLPPWQQALSRRRGRFPAPWLLILVPPRPWQGFPPPRRHGSFSAPSLSGAFSSFIGNYHPFHRDRYRTQAPVSIMPRYTGRWDTPGEGRPHCPGFSAAGPVRPCARSCGGLHRARHCPEDTSVHPFGKPMSHSTQSGFSAAVFGYRLLLERSSAPTGSRPSSLGSKADGFKVERNPSDATGVR